MPWLAGHVLDLDDPLVDLGHLHREQGLEQPRVRARDHDLGSLGPLTDLGDVGLQALAVAVGLGRNLLPLRQQGLDLPEIEQRVAPLGLLDDPRDDVPLAPGELLVGHLPLGVAQLLEDHLLRGLRADPALEVIGDLDLLLGNHADLRLHRLGRLGRLERLDLRRRCLGRGLLRARLRGHGGFLRGLGLGLVGVDLLELLEPDPQVTGLGVDRGPDTERVLVHVGMLLLVPGLVRGGHRLLQAGEDRLERDALLPLELAERSDHLCVHRLLLLCSAPQSNTVRADAMSS